MNFLWALVYRVVHSRKLFFYIFALSNLLCCHAYVKQLMKYIHNDSIEPLSQNTYVSNIRLVLNNLHSW